MHAERSSQTMLCANPFMQAPTFAAAGLGGGMLGARSGGLLLPKRAGSAVSMPWAAQQTMAMSTGEREAGRKQHRIMRSLWQSVAGAGVGLHDHHVWEHPGHAREHARERHSSRLRVTAARASCTAHCTALQHICGQPCMQRGQWKRQPACATGSTTRIAAVHGCIAAPSARRKCCFPCQGCRRLQLQ